MININDVIVPTKGTGKYLKVKVLPFELEPSNGITLYWAIYAEEVNQELSEPGAALLEGNLIFPQSEYDNWGTDDSVVTDWVMTELGVTEVTE